MVINGAFMLLCLGASFYYNTPTKLAMLLSGFATSGLGLLIWATTRKGEAQVIRKRDGYLTVTLGWVVMSLSGTLPFILSGTLPSLHDAFFETMSGYTTTGASVIADLAPVPADILLWRSLTQWIGGMGIIVLAVAILPLLGIGGMQLFAAEATGLKADKMKPRISDAAKRLWAIYVGLTAAESIALKIAGLTWFDAINHSLTTMATGGFGTHNSSAIDFTPSVQWILVVFMFLAGTNFAVIYYILRGKIEKVWRDEELWYYLGGTLFFIFSITAVLTGVKGHEFSNALRDTAFQVVSVITTTGFISADYTTWTPFLTMTFFLLLFVGGSAGSTAGGVKVVRHIVLAKNSFLEFKRQLHRSAVIPVRLNGRAIDPTITYNVVAFIIIYTLVFAIGSFLLALIGLDFDTCLGAAATCLGNVGPGIGKVGPAYNFAWLPDAAKWVLSFLMLVGRLELFTVLILFSPFYWSVRG